MQNKANITCRSGASLPALPACAVVPAQPAQTHRTTTLSPADSALLTPPVVRVPVVDLMVDPMVDLVAAFVRTCARARKDASERPLRGAAASCLPLPPPLEPSSGVTRGMPPLYRYELGERVRQARQRLSQREGEAR